LWQIEPSVSANPFLRFVQRIILRLFANPQREYNAAALRSMYALSEQIDQTTQLLFNVASQYGNHINWLDQRVQELTQQVQELSQRSDMLEFQEIHQIGQQIRDFADQIAGLEETTSQILVHIGGVHAPPLEQKE